MTKMIYDRIENLITYDKFHMYDEDFFEDEDLDYLNAYHLYVVETEDSMFLPSHKMLILLAVDVDDKECRTIMMEVPKTARVIIDPGEEGIGHRDYVEKLKDEVVSDTVTFVDESDVPKQIPLLPAPDNEDKLKKAIDSLMEDMFEDLNLPDELRKRFRNRKEEEEEDDDE